MKWITTLVARQQPKTFRASYSPEYKTFTYQHIATDTSHPLQEAQKRRLAERKKEGLWWHPTTGLDINKLSCVRSWARRRLRNAVKDELKQRGYDETGRLVNLKVLQNQPDLVNVLRQGKTLDLTGSLRLNVQPPLIPAKYSEIRAEVGQLFEVMLQAIKEEAAGRSFSIKTRSRSQDPLPAKPSHARKQRMPLGKNERRK